MVRVDQIGAGDALHNVSENLPSNQPGATRLEGSVPLLAQAELQEFQNDALAETQEDLGFALGGRLRNTRSGGAESDNVRGRVLMHKLVAELASVEAVDLESLLSGPQGWLHSPQLLAALQAQTPDPGQAALQLAAWLAHGRPNAKLRSKLEEALASLAADDSLALSLFGALEFGAPSPALRQELTRLYHKASAPHQKLSQWLEALGEPEGRKRKLRTMLRVLSYELSASGQPIVGSHLASVIGDLKQLLRLLGLDAYCHQATTALALPGLQGEALLGCLVRLVEQVWVNADSVAEALPPLPAAEHYRVAQALSKLVQLLPEECFGDGEQKKQLEEAIVELRDRALE